MKILFKSFIAAFIVFAGLSANAASITAWSVSTPFSGNCLSINTTGQTSITFSVTCVRNLSENTKAKFHLQAYAANGTNKAMHSDISIAIADFFYGGGLKTTVTKTYTVQVDLNGTYYPNETNVYLVATQGLTSVPSNNYPIVIPIKNNTICCYAAFTNVNTEKTLTGTTPIGGNNSYTYQWQSSVDSLSWPDITVNGTSKDYTIPASTLTQTTFYRRIVRSNSIPAVPQNVSAPTVIFVRPARMGNVEEDLVVGKAEVLLYPNPFTNEFEIDENGVDIKNIEIINSSGASIYKSEGLITNLIKTDAWDTGIYFIKIETTENKIITKKLIKI